MYSPWGLKSSIEVNSTLNEVDKVISSGLLFLTHFIAAGQDTILNVQAKSEHLTLRL